MNEFPMPANLRPPAPPPDKPAPTTLAAAFRSFAGQETFTLDPDLRLTLEDMACGRPWGPFIQETITEALRFYLGR